MKKTEIYYDSRDGESRIHAVRYEPEERNVKDGRPVGILQIVHGMAEYVERYEETARFFTDRGFVVTGEDHLGHGGSVAADGTYGYFCKRDPATVVVRDVHRLKKMTQEAYPGTPYFILGHSMGSFILRNYLCRYGTGIQGAIIVGTGMQPGYVIAFARLVAGVQNLFLGGGHVSGLMDKMVFGAYNKRVENPRTPNDWISRNAENVDRYNADPLCGFPFTVNGFQTLFELIARIRRTSNLEKVPKNLPVFFASGTDDPVGDYGEGVKRAYDSLDDVGLEHLALKLYEGGRHEILNETNGGQVMQDVCDWMMAKLSGETS